MLRGNARGAPHLGFGQHAAGRVRSPVGLFRRRVPGPNGSYDAPAGTLARFGCARNRLTVALASVAAASLAPGLWNKLT